MRKPVSLTLEKPLYDLLTRAAKQERLSRSAFVAIAVEEKLGLRPRQTARPVEGKRPDDGENGDAA